MPMLLKTRPIAKISAPVRPKAWHSVSIIRGRHACEAVVKLNGRKWLSAEAPQLPVTGCDAKQCDCRYRHHADRRSADRRETSGLVSAPPKEGERRTGRIDRRGKER
jgi:hypothetical protein